MRRRDHKLRDAERGVTLIELIISITLVAAIAGGMLTAMRTSLASLEKTQGRLEDNRRAMAVQQAILRQVSSLIPAMGDCGAPDGGGPRISAFGGNAGYVHFVTTYSLGEGFRGYPRLVEIQVAPEAGGTVRLLMNERLYYGPATLRQICVGNQFLPFIETPQTTVIATGLAYARFFYHERIPGQLDAGEWLPIWARNPLPSAIRLELAPRDPSPTRVPMVSLHIPIRITRDIGATYVDQ